MASPAVVLLLAFFLLCILAGLFVVAFALLLVAVGILVLDKIHAPEYNRRYVAQQTPLTTQRLDELGCECSRDKL